VTTVRGQDERAEPRTVGLREFRDRIEEVRRTVVDPVAGVFGPSSKMWEINRHSITFLAGGRAGLLQAAHPFVAHGVEQHSVSVSDPIGRFNRTFAAVFDMVYGDLETAMQAAVKTHSLHATIVGDIREDVGAYSRGTPYQANDANALLWVHATLWDSSIRIFEQFVRPLASSEKEQYYRETRLFAQLFGVPDHVIPETWDDFIAYNEQMWESEILSVGRPAAAICKFLLEPPNPALRAIMRWYEVMIGGQMPPRLRRQYGLRYDEPDDQRRYQRSLRRLRALESRLPRRLRYLPAYLAALRRLEGRTTRDPIGEALNRVFVGSTHQRGARAGQKAGD
jgi:uncharacterized protein (DUF2236 family)